MQQVAVLLKEFLRLPLCLGHFLKREGMNKKKENVILLQLSRVIKIPKVFGVYTAAFWHKIWTKRWWYFLLVALDLHCHVS